MRQNSTKYCNGRLNCIRISFYKWFQCELQPFQSVISLLICKLCPVNYFEVNGTWPWYLLCNYFSRGCSVADITCCSGTFSTMLWEIQMDNLYPIDVIMIALLHNRNAVSCYPFFIPRVEIVIQFLHFMTFVDKFPYLHPQRIKYRTVITCWNSNLRLHMDATIFNQVICLPYSGKSDILYMSSRVMPFLQAISIEIALF